tara:strand:+ start:2078 stop:2284 length:207 start_codon:yes stop_codon:yes gene_type:complete
MTGIMASPSRPSVRFTELLDPTMTRVEKIIKKIPRLIEKSFRNGKNTTSSKSATCLVRKYTEIIDINI